MNKDLDWIIAEVEKAISGKRQVTVDGHTCPLPKPFIVIATQDNVGTEEEAEKNRPQASACGLHKGRICEIGLKFRRGY